MLNLVDAVIQTVFDTGWTAPPSKPKFFFTIPDEDWQTNVSAGTDNRLNIYLYDVRENRDFRLPGWDSGSLPDKTSVLWYPPVYFDCHYLISAWSAAEDTEALSPITDEHAILAETLRIILRNNDVSPSALGIAGGGPAFQGSNVYLSLATPETPRVLNDFWSTMKLPWRLAIQLIVTAPLDLLQDPQPIAPVVKLIERYGFVGGASFEERIEMGGWVQDATTKKPIVGATVLRLATTGGAVLASTTSDSQGRFVFGGLTPGPVKLRVTAAGQNTINRTLNIPGSAIADHVFNI